MDSPEQAHPSRMTRERLYDAYVALLARHDLAIRRFVRMLLPSQDGVDDVMQETALECWKKFGEFQSDEPDADADEFVRWACVIARYKSMSWQRDKSRDRLVFRESVIEQLSSTALETVNQQEQQRNAVEACLADLPPDQRRLVLSVHSPNESIARIANESGQKARRLYSKVNRIRSLLLVCVERRLAAEAGNG
ncbi:MAG: sigma-70 family RNA polymerase sigma factor [Planctomycetota bacterium]